MMWCIKPIMSVSIVHCWVIAIEVLCWIDVVSIAWGSVRHKRLLVILLIIGSMFVVIQTLLLPLNILDLLEIDQRLTFMATCAMIKQNAAMIVKQMPIQAKM